MPSTTTTWEDTINQAMKAQGASQAPASDEQLLARLRAMKDLYVHNSAVFNTVIEQTSSLLFEGVSSAYLIRVFNDYEKLYEHTSPNEAAWLKDVSEAYSALKSWFLTQRITKPSKPWIRLFESFKYPSQALLLFTKFRDMSVAHFDDARLLDVLSKASDGSGLKVLRISHEHLNAAVRCLVILLNLEKSVLEVVLPKVTKDISREHCIPSIETMLGMLPCIEYTAPEEQKEHIKRWWEFGISGQTETRTLRKLFQIIMQHSRTSLELEKKFLAEIMQEGIARNVNGDGFSMANTCANKIACIDNATWRSHCYTYASKGKQYFESNFVCQFDEAIRVGMFFGQTLQDEAAQNYLDLLIMAKDMSKVAKCVKEYFDAPGVKIANYNTMITNAHRSENPLAYLNQVLELQQVFSKLSSNQQSILQNQIFIEDLPMLVDVRRATHFLKILPTLDDIIVNNQQRIIDAYTIWQKKPYCSELEFKEKLSFENLITPLLLEQFPYVMDEMIAAPESVRRLIADVVLPNITDASKIAELWAKIKTKPQLQSPAYLAQVLALQTEVDNLQSTDFKKLLDFNNQELAEKRQKLLYALYHHEVDVPEHTERYWWSLYFDALVRWIFKLVDAKKPELDKDHHKNAADKLKRLVSVVDELNRIQTGKSANFITSYRPISNNLEREFKNYASLYNGSWWRSSDRAKLSDSTLSAIAKNTQSTYQEAFDAIERIMNGVVQQDKLHKNRNKKGFSRLYDISVHLLYATLNDALICDSQNSECYKSQVKALINRHKSLIDQMDMEVPAFAHLLEITDAIDQSTLKNS